MESPKETGFQAAEVPVLCINNCGFFGSSATMNMCSKCHKDTILNEQQASSIESIVNGCSTKKEFKPTIVETVEPSYEPKPEPPQPGPDVGSGQCSDAKPNEGPNRCSSCRKRVGLTGFSCKCGELFCSNHRYSDKHECSFDYRGAARDSISKANPVVRADKLDKI